MKPAVFLEFADRQRCARQLASDLAQVLNQTLAQQARAGLLLPGGSSPQVLLPHLAAQALDWARIDLSPTDERWVASDDPHSNYRLLHAALPQANCLDPRQGDSPQRAASQWQAQLAVWLPFAAVLLGMGEDGHFASLFPGMLDLQAALDPLAVPAALPAQAPVEPCQRLSLNLNMLCQTGWLGLLAFGAAKRSLIEEALAGSTQLPVQALLDNGHVPVKIYWAP
ncbi:6-phosphogluconolactonase [Aquipseudomonas campi]|uniref:6-phosphogluconolactonase n=1 Tax=Aquipseudomonas campi TaxID=2731681 RepID=A0A6M8FHR4_9GAMM|nr:6-phosphogluconolactonase [Pseudomonas campi]QKE63832.1 6-phosphogluconolactonase [Pseudomonas campi]